MRKFNFFSTLVLLLLAGKPLFAQEFSNKGKDFYLCFPSHVPSGSSLAQMYVFITSDKNSDGQVSYNGQIQNFSVTANTVTTVPINRALAYIPDNSTNNPDKGIRVKVTDGKPPVVVYTQIYAAARTAASLILPVNVLGRKYRTISFAQGGGGRSQFNIIAVEPNTTVRIRLVENGVPASSTFDITINNAGDVYQYQNSAGQDLTGTYIESIATATEPCKKIAVFSGSSTTTINSNSCSGSSSDPLFQQCYPVTSWGKNFGVVPISGNGAFHVRVMASEDNTSITYNGSPINLNAGQIYPALNSNPVPETQPFFISADKPISVSQYLLSQNCAGGIGDPEMIILNPIEQNISDITIFTSTRQAITAQYVNVLIPTTGVPTFKINGSSVVGFTPMPSNPAFSYLRHQFPSGDNSYTLRSDSGFNAICYGLGSVETYGYSAGTNVRDLYQYVSIDNGPTTVNFPATCKGTQFNFSMTFPFQPTQIRWEFNGLFPDVTVNSPTYDNTFVVNGKTLYQYNLPGSYSINTAGTYPIRIVAQSSSTDGCNGEQEIEYDITVYDKPTADFSFTSNGCVSSAVNFTSNANGSGRPLDHWHWNFGDGVRVEDVTNTSHTYSASGTYPVKYAVTNDIGCESDTVTKNVVLNDPPVAGFQSAGPYCKGMSVTFTDQSTIATGSSIGKWTWNFGDATPPVIATTGAAQTHTFATAGTFTVTLVVESTGGCLSTVFSQPVTIGEVPTAQFALPAGICLPSGAAQFTDQSTPGSGSISTWAWDFGDGNNSNVQSPLHNYTGAGPFNVQLTVTNSNGCQNSITKNLNTISPEPQASFTAPPEVCLGSPAAFNSTASAATGSTITQWSWNFGDGNTNNTQNPSHTYAAPGTYTVTLNVTSAVGCPTVNNFATKTVIVNPLPVADFNISTPNCANRNVTFTDISVPNSGTLNKWTWNFGDGNNVVLTNGSPFTHVYTNPGNYTITLQVENSKGCVSTVISKPITISVLPKSGFISPDICVNDVLAPLTDTSKISAGTITGWQWNFGDANANAGNPNTSTLQNPTHHFTQPGNYSVQLITTSNAGCTDTLVQTVVVNGIPVSNFTVQGGATSLCSNKELTITDASTIAAGKILRTEIFWDIADPSIKTTDNSPAAGKTYTHTYPEFGSPASRNVTIRYDVYSGLTCVTSFTRDISLLATPTLSFGSALPVCSNDPSFQITSAQLENGLPGTGIYSGPGVTPTGTFNPAGAGAGTHILTYTYNANNGCSNSITTTIDVNPTPITDAGPDKVVLEGGVVVLTPTIINNIPVTYSWSPPTGLSNPNIASVSASPPNDITYTLTITSDKGCFTSDDVNVRLLLAPVIPNVFTPNKDGINDKFIIQFLESYPGCVVEIYNRYGQIIFRSIGYSKPWDGTYNGKDAPAGTYYYIVDPKNGRKRMSGFIDLVR
jgi:gliding motility-associated-like protein